MSQRATFAPEATKRCAMAKPIPPQPPVMTAARPFRSSWFIVVVDVGGSRNGATGDAFAALLLHAHLLDFGVHFIDERLADLLGVLVGHGLCLVAHLGELLGRELG